MTHARRPLADFEPGTDVEIDGRWWRIMYRYQYGGVWCRPLRDGGRLDERESQRRNFEDSTPVDAHAEREGDETNQRPEVVDPLRRETSKGNLL